METHVHNVFSPNLIAILFTIQTKFIVAGNQIYSGITLNRPNKFMMKIVFYLSGLEQFHGVCDSNECSYVLKMLCKRVTSLISLFLDYRTFYILANSLFVEF